MKKLLAIAGLGLALAAGNASAAGRSDVAIGAVVGGVAGYLIGNHNAQPTYVAPVQPAPVVVEQPAVARVVVEQPAYWVDEFGYTHYYHRPHHHHHF